MNRRKGRSGIAIIAVTRSGARLAAQIQAGLASDEQDEAVEEATLHVRGAAVEAAPDGAAHFDSPLSERVAELFPAADALVFVLALGATVRLVAPLLGRKQDDPAVLCVDDAGQFVIPVLGGHQRDANGLARRVADAIGATAIVTTAGEAAGLPNLDRLGADAGWQVEASPETLKRAAAALLAGEAAAVYLPPAHEVAGMALPVEWSRVESLESLLGWPGPRIAVTDRLIDQSLMEQGGPLLIYRPRTLVLGVGCSTGAPPEEVVALARATVAEAGLAWGSVHTVATIDRRLMHPALVKLVWETDAQYFPVYTSEQLAELSGLPSPSVAVERHVGTPGVCEPAAILASAGGELLVPKRKSANATVAVARRGHTTPSPGKLTLVGMGPGPLDLMAPRARAALRDATLLIGYRGYLELLTSLVAESRMRSYDLGEERERAAEAIRLAREGYRVALVSSGDIGIYGMAGLVYEQLHEQQLGTDQTPAVEVVPGITAASAANALLGAPLMLDFAALSLSDLLVPWDGIRKRLLAAAEGDLVVVLYNPASARRRQPFEDALAILRQHRTSATPVGLVREAYRADQAVTLTTLGELNVEHVDMRTVVVIGCSRTVVMDGRMVTRRGYLDERP